MYGFITIQTLFWGAYFGVVIGAFAVYYNKVVIGKFVRFLMREQAFAEENARPLGASGVRSPFIRVALRKGGMIHNILGNAPGGAGAPLYYIKPEKKDKAVRQYDSSGTSLLLVLLTAVLFLVIIAVAFQNVPEFIDALKKLYDSISG